MAELLSPREFTRDQCVSLQEQTFPRLFKMSEFAGLLQQQLQIGATFPSITDCMAAVSANAVATMKPYKWLKQNKIEGFLRARCCTATCPWHIYFNAQLHEVLGARKYDTELVDLFGSNSLVEEYINI